MTEYDFSPEAYERYLATQTRIANWVEKTEQHRSQFEPAIQPSPSPSSLPPARAGLSSHDSHRRLRKRSPPPALPQQAYPQQQQQRYQQPRHLFIHPPSPASESDDDDNDDDAYGHGPGPIPLTSPAVVYPQQQQHRQMAPAYSYPQAMPVMPHPQVVVPPTYMTAPHHKSSSHHRHRSSHTSSRSHNSPGYYNVASPPVSPGYQYAYPHMVAGHPGYMMMQPQPPRPMQYMYL